jgi:hypothetical protein
VPQAEPLAPADPEDDIFGDAGKAYEPALPHTPRDGAAAAAAPAEAAPQGAGPANGAGGRARGAYFDTVDDMRDLPALPKPGARPPGGRHGRNMCLCGDLRHPRDPWPPLRRGGIVRAGARRRPPAHCERHPALQV